MTADRRKAMIEADHPRLSVARQCALVSIARSTFYRETAPETAVNLDLMRRIDEQFPGNALVRFATDDTPSSARGPRAGAETRATPNGEDGTCRDLPAPQDDGSAS
jgi:putative transposase